MKKILVTGSSGFVGGAVVAELLMRQDVELLLLVRASDATQGLERVKDNLSKFSCSAQAIQRLTVDQILVGDLLAPELFLDDARIDQVSHVINCAAIASFGENNDIWRVNVEGTFKLAARMAALPAFVKFVHVGTAMSSAPDQGEIVKEDLVLSSREDHIVDYTYSKSYIENKIKQELPHLPLVIARPSIVVGHSQEGCTPSGSIFWVFKMVMKLEKFLCSLDDRVDVIPVDYCAKSLVFLLDHGCTKEMVYHISAGERSSNTFSEIDSAFATAEKSAPLAPNYLQVDFSEIVKERKNFKKIYGPCNERLMLRAMRLYGEFARLNVVFSNDKLLRLGMSSPPGFTSYIDRCVETTKGMPIQDLMRVDFK